MDIADIDGMDPDTEIIQHDASCDPDSNGAMILDTAGEVIAVLFAGSDGGSQFCAGISINYVMSTVNDLSFNTIRDELLAGCTENILDGDFVMEADDPLEMLEELSTYTEVTGDVNILSLVDYDLLPADQSRVYKV